MSNISPDHRALNWVFFKCFFFCSWRVEIGRNIQAVWSPQVPVPCRWCSFSSAELIPEQPPGQRLHWLSCAASFLQHHIEDEAEVTQFAEKPLQFLVAFCSFHFKAQSCGMKTGECLTSLTAVAHVPWEYIYEYGSRKTPACEWVTGVFSCATGFRRGALIVFCKSQQQDLLLQWSQTLVGMSRRVRHLVFYENLYREDRLREKK